MLRPALTAVCLAFCLLFSGGFAFAQGTGTGGGGTGAGGGGGAGAGGILIDADGVLQPQQIAAGVVSKRPKGKPVPESGQVCVSLRRLSELLSSSRPEDIPVDAFVLGGLTRIDQVVVAADERDVLLIGPGEPQASGTVATYVGEASGRPLMRTGDLAILLAQARNGRLVVRCSIDPEPARLREYNERIRATIASVNFNNAGAWYEGLARILGRQIVTVGGVPEDSRISNVLAAADYSMKRIALGVEPSGVSQIKGQLAYAGADKGATMKRWWFAPQYDDLAVNPERTVFQLSGPRVKLLAQEELILDDGRRVGADRNRQSTEVFARQFTEHFEELTAVRPIFADLKNQFDLAVVASLLVREKLLDRFDIRFQPPAETLTRLSPACKTPRFVETGANIRRVNKSTIVGVVGGVEISTGAVLGRESPLSGDAHPLRGTPPRELGQSEFSWRTSGR